MNKPAPNLIAIKNRFIILQCVLICGVMLVYAGYVFFQYVRTEKAIFLSGVEQTTYRIAKQIAQTTAVPADLVHAEYIIFAINKDDGSYVIKRPTIMDVDPAVWESHAKKLIYEMEKQEDGWIIYPQVGVMEFSRDRRVIRYLPVDSQPWIVVVEATLRSNGYFAKRIFTQTSFGFFFVIMVAACVAIAFLMNQYFLVMKKMIADTVENDLMHAPGEHAWHDTIIDARQKAESIVPQSSQTTIINQYAQRSAEAIVQQQRVASVAVPTNTTASVVVESPLPAHQPTVVTPIANRDDARPDADRYDDLTLDVNQIKSEALKKVLRDMRKR